MKKSLIIGVSALLLSLVAVTGCAEGTPSGSGTTSQVVENVDHVKDINVLDMDKTTLYNPVSVKDGKEVYVKGAQIYGRYTDKLYIHEGFKSIESDADIEGIAIEVRKEGTDFSTHNVGEIVNVKGTVCTLNGHFVINDAEVEVVKQNPKGEINPNDPVMILNGVDRFTTLFSGPTLNGLGAYTTLQAVEDFGTITDAGKTIKVVFPGEDLTNSEENELIMDYVIPAGLSKNELNLLNKSVFKDLLDESEQGSTLKAGQTFTAMTAISFNPKIGFEYVPFLGCGKDFGRLGMTKNYDAYDNFEDFKTEWVTPLIKPEILESFPNLSANDTTGKSLVYSYVPSDVLFDKGQIEINVNTHEMDTVFDLIKENLDAQNYVVGEEEKDPNTGIQQMEFASDDSGEQKYTVVLQNLVLYGKVYIIVDTESCIYIDDELSFDTYAKAYDALNENVSVYARRHPFNTVQALGFKSALPDFSKAMTDQGFDLGNIVVNKENEDYYRTAINIGIAPITQHRVRYEFNAAEPEIKKNKEGKSVLVVPEEVEIRYNRAIKTVQKQLVDAGFVFSEHQMLISGKNPDGSYIPAYFYYNEVTGESVVYTLDIPTKKLNDKGEPTGDWIGHWGILIIDEVVTAEISSWVFEPALDMEPTYTWTQKDTDYFKKALGTTEDFILPGFDYFEFIMLPGKTEDGRKGVTIEIMADNKDPDNLAAGANPKEIDKAYRQTLIDAGWTVDDGKPVGEGKDQHLLYTATKEGSGITYQFAADNEIGLLIITVVKNSK